MLLCYLGFCQNVVSPSRFFAHLSLIVTGTYSFLTLYFPFFLFLFSSSFSRALCCPCIIFLNFPANLWLPLRAILRPPLVGLDPHDPTIPLFILKGPLLALTGKRKMLLALFFRVIDGPQLFFRRELDTARDNFNIMDSVTLGLLNNRREAVDARGMVVSISLYMAMFVMGSRLPLLLPVHDVSGVLGLALAQLVPNACTIVMACCIFWWRVVEPTGVPISMDLDAWMRALVISSLTMK